MKEVEGVQKMREEEKGGERNRKGSREEDGGQKTREEERDGMRKEKI